MHTLVLETFVGYNPDPDKFCCCHFPDNDGRNNHLKNLRWDTYKNNQLDTLLNGTQYSPESINARCCVLNETSVYIIRALYEEYDLGWIANQFNISKANVCMIGRFETWRKLLRKSSEENKILVEQFLENLRKEPSPCPNHSQ